jgi:hypothetical protein
MTHEAFEAPDNLNGHKASYWEAKAQEAEKRGQPMLAIKYYRNVIATALGLGRTQRAQDAIRRLMGGN